MGSPHKTAWGGTKARLRGSVEAMLERAAGVIREALTDWEVEEGPGEAPPGLPELPPLEPALFVAAMRAKAEELLWRMAKAINQAPTGQIVAASEDCIRDLLADLYREALETGLRMRLDAAEAALPPRQRPSGAWTRRWRRMKAAGDAPAPFVPFPSRSAGYTGMNDEGSEP